MLPLWRLIQTGSAEPRAGTVAAGSRVLPHAVLLVGAILLAVFVLPPLWGLVAVTVAAVVEIAEFFFWIWLSRRRGVQAGAEALVGKTARVVAACRPDGRVRVEGELWRARCEAGADEGESVRVLSIEGLTLEVARID
jgi:membrane protein implicated in regulation of membrane protease activity